VGEVAHDPSLEWSAALDADLNDCCCDGDDDDDDDGCCCCDDYYYCCYYYCDDGGGGDGCDGHDLRHWNYSRYRSKMRRCYEMMVSVGKDSMKLGEKGMMMKTFPRPRFVLHLHRYLLNWNDVALGPCYIFSYLETYSDLAALKFGTQIRCLPGQDEDF